MMDYLWTYHPWEAWFLIANVVIWSAFILLSPVLIAMGNAWFIGAAIGSMGAHHD